MDDKKMFVGEYSSEELALFEDIFFPQSYIKEAESDIENILSLLDVDPQGKTLLDIPCGVGRHSLHLADKGFKVTGVDLCKDYLEKIKNEAVKRQINYEVVQEDMRHFKRNNYFEVVMCLWDSLGICGGLNDDKIILKNLYDSLIPGGKLLLELYPLEVWLYNICNNNGSSSNINFTNTHYIKALEEKNISILKHEISFADDFKRIKVKVIERDNTSKEEYEVKFMLRPRSISNWLDIMEEIGYKNISFYSGFNLNKYTSRDIIDGRPAKILASK